MAAFRERVGGEFSEGNETFRMQKRCDAFLVCVFGGAMALYISDFLVKLADGRIVIVETRGMQDIDVSLDT